MFAIDNGNGRAPVALAADVPVAQAKLHRALALAHFLQLFHNGFFASLVVHAVEGAGIDHCARARPGRLHGCGRQSGIRRLDDYFDGQIVLAGKFKIALVAGRHAHNRACAVFGKHKIAQPDGHALAGKGMRGVCSCEDAFFFEIFALAVYPVHIADALDKVPDFIGPLIACEQFFHKRMLRRQGQEGYAINGIWPGGEDFDFGNAVVIPFEVKNYGCAFRPADPVALHGQDPFGPAALELFQIPQEFLGIICNAQKPLGQFLLLDNAVATPAFAVLHLFVGQDRMAGRAPVLRGLFTVNQAFFEHAQKKRLLPAIVFRPAGGDFAGPVIGKTHAFELGAHFGDIVVCPFGGVQVMLDGRVFGRQAKGVPAHWVDYVIALHAADAGRGIAY